MGTHAGNEGSVQISSNEIAEVKSWSIEEQGETADSTTFDNTNGWRTHKHTLKGWSGEVECCWDEADTNGQGALTIGSSVTLNLYPEGDDVNGDVYYTGTATVTGISRQASVDGMVEASFSFQGNGALTQSTVSI